MEATSMYSCFVNLYFKVVRNLGFTSKANDLTSSTMGARYSSFMSVAISISLFQALIFLIFLAERIKDAAAISLGLYLSKEASKRAIS